MRRHHSRLFGAPRRPGPLRRSLDDRVIAGVVSGISSRTGIDRAVVRAAFVLITLSGGLGIAAYVVAWLFIPVEGDESNAASRALTDRRGIALALALVPLLAVTLLIASIVGAGWLTTISWPLFIAAGGLVLVWRNVGPAERKVIERSLEPVSLLYVSGPNARRQRAARVGLGVAFASFGVLLLTRGRPAHRVVEPLGGLLLVVLAVAISFGPWWLRLVRDLVEERQARVRAEERAEMATQVHDSVLQTLALIQRQSGDPHEVVKLARAQERELRSWLFEGRPPGAREPGATISGAVERIQSEVEGLFGVPVEAVVVGDCVLDDDLQSLVEAGREATVNAAKWSGAPEVSVFVEVEPDSVAMYVRDRGKGFDEAAVAEDRRGLAESIRGRMARHGGRAEIRSIVGEGTEVTLTMDRR